LEIDPTGQRLLLSGQRGQVLLVPIESGVPRKLEGFSASTSVFTNAFDRAGRQAAAAPYISAPHEKVIRIWDLDSGVVKVLGPLDGAANGWEDGFNGLSFTPDGHLVSCNRIAGLHLWNVEDGTRRTLYKAQDGQKVCMAVAVSPDGRHVLHLSGADDYHADDVVSTDVEQGTSRVLPGLVGGLAIAIDSTGTLMATGDSEGIVRVGPVTGTEQHLLLGHKGLVRALAISPDGKWIACGGDDRLVRLWPMPKGRPFHTLPYDEILRRLRAITNVRVVAEAKSPTGYRLDESGPFPGWKTVPSWQDP